jgi:hypothetical protein
MISTQTIPNRSQLLGPTVNVSLLIKAIGYFLPKSCIRLLFFRIAQPVQRLALNPLANI